MLNLDFVGPHGITDTYGGGFYVYAFAIMSGIFASIIASGVKFRRYRVPTDFLAGSIIFIIPASLFGASFRAVDGLLCIDLSTIPMGLLEVYKGIRPLVNKLIKKEQNKVKVK